MKTLTGTAVAAAIVVIVAWIVLSNVLFTVDERELVVVLQFGEPVANYREPGLRAKIPFIQEVRRLPKTYQFWLGQGREILVDVPTADGKKIEVTPWAIWRISDPVRFIQELRTVENAENRVKDFVRSEIRDVLTANILAEAVRSSNRKLTYSLQVEIQPDVLLLPVSEGNALPAEQGAAAPLTPSTPLQPGAQEEVRLGREKLVEQVKQAVQLALRQTAGDEKSGRGIELVDVGIARIDFVDVVREEAFKRLIAFMESVAASYTNEGQRRKQEILNRTQYEIETILGQAKRDANRIRGEVEAEVIQMYATAIHEMGDFYDFLRLLDLYKKAVGPNTRLILSTDSQLFSILKKLPEEGTVTPSPPPAVSAVERGS